MRFHFEVNDMKHHIRFIWCVRMTMAKAFCRCCVFNARTTICNIETVTAPMCVVRSEFVASFYLNAECQFSGNPASTEREKKSVRFFLFIQKRGVESEGELQFFFHFLFFSWKSCLGLMHKFFGNVGNHQNKFITTTTTVTKTVEQLEAIAGA